ncbi:MAG: DUF3038 domain-containing protein [Cyanobacteria bacterium P01_H01_bin.121]
MSVSVSARSPQSEVTTPVPTALDQLPDIPLKVDLCPKRARQQLDFILLALEALDLGGSEALLKVGKELGLQPVIRNRVYLWRLRCSNPLRRYTHRPGLSLTEGKAMAAIACYVARRLTAQIRQLVLAHQQLQEKELPLESHFRLADYLERFRAHFRARMNPKRASVLVYQDDEKLNQLALALLQHLLFCTGTAGAQRFWISLFDGEV